MMDKSEAQVVQEVKLVLRLAEPNLHIWRQNTGAFKSGRRFVTVGEKGTPDFIGYDCRGRFVGIECKRPAYYDDAGHLVKRSGRLSKEQVEWLKRLAEHGGVGIVAHSGDEALKKLVDAGCLPMKEAK